VILIDSGQAEWVKTWGTVHEYYNTCVQGRWNSSRAGGKKKSWGQ